MAKYDIIVARYKEDLSWVSQFDEEKYNVIIYNKGAEDVPFPNIKLENIGRDAETFVRHIVNNYDNLSEYSIFLQGNPLSHLGGFAKIIKEHIDENFYGLGHIITNETVSGWYELLVGKGTRPENASFTYLPDTARRILGGETPTGEIRFTAGQQHIVHRDIIRRRDIGLYKYILNEFPNDFVLPWHMERLWYYIWRVK
jgi:hypothetical protein